MTNKQGDLKNIDLSTPPLVSFGDVVVGGTYPLFGHITKVFETTPEGTIIEINYSTHITVRLDTPELVQKLKARAFEPGIFLTTITGVGKRVEGDCSQVLFGKALEYSA